MCFITFILHIFTIYNHLFCLELLTFSIENITIFKFTFLLDLWIFIYKKLQRRDFYPQKIDCYNFLMGKNRHNCYNSYLIFFYHSILSLYVEKLKLCVCVCVDNTVFPILWNMWLIFSTLQARSSLTWICYNRCWGLLIYGRSTLYRNQISIISLSEFKPVNWSAVYSFLRACMIWNVLQKWLKWSLKNVHLIV